MGNRILGDLNRSKITIALEADGNPKLVPGSTVEVNSKILSGKYLVESINTSVSAEAGYSTSLNASAYYGDTAFEEPPLEIEAAYTALQVVGIGDPQYMVEFDGSASWSSVGPIVRYVWTFPNLTQDGSDPTVWYTFQDTDIMNGNSVTISLQVFDGLGNTDIISSGITLEYLQSQATVKYRHLYGALNTRGVASVDGGVTWNTLTIPAISVAASNFAISGGFTSSGHALYGGSDGNIYKTVDAALSSYTVFDGSSPVLDVTIPELDASFAAAGMENGAVYKSEDFGETWEQIGDFAFPILQVKYNYTNYNEITILGSGLNNIYITFDSGGSWNQVTTGTTGLWLTDSNVKNYVAHTTGIKNISDNAEVSGSATNPFPAITYAINVDDNSALYSGIMAVDDTGQHYNYSGGLQATQFNPTNKTKHMIRDGEVPFLVYYANASGIGKSLDGNITMSGLYYPSGIVPAGGWGFKVAYGPLAGPQPPARLVWQGSALDVPGFPMSSTAFAYLAPSGGTGGWQYIPNSDFTTQTLVAVTAGYLIVGGGLGVSLIALDADGIPTATEDYATFNDPGYGGGLAPITHGLYFSRVPASNPPKVYGLISSFPNPSMPYVQVFDDFYNDPSQITVISHPDSGVLIHAINPTRLSSKGKDTVLTEIVPGLFSSNSSWLLYHTDTAAVDTTDDTHGLWAPAFYPGLSTDWYSISKRGSDTFYYLVNPDAGTAVVTNIAASVDPSNIYGSSILDSDIYYATTAGVYRVGSYGVDSPVQILAANAGESLVAFSVTHDVNETKDYLVAVLDVAATDQSLVKYSLDGGVTWQQATSLPGAIGTSVKCWYVDVR